MNIRIPQRFIEERGGQLWGAGDFDLAPEVAQRLIEQGKAHSLETPPKEAMVTQGQDSEKPSDDDRRAEILKLGLEEGSQATEVSDIPPTFPSRDRLIAAGLNLVAELKQLDRESLKKLDPTLTTAQLTKIGLEIEKL